MIETVPIPWISYYSILLLPINPSVQYQKLCCTAFSCFISYRLPCYNVVLIVSTSNINIFAPFLAYYNTSCSSLLHTLVTPPFRIYLNILLSIWLFSFMISIVLRCGPWRAELSRILQFRLDYYVSLPFQVRYSTPFCHDIIPPHSDVWIFNSHGICNLFPLYPLFHPSQTRRR